MTPRQWAALRADPEWREQQCRLWDEEHFAHWLRDEFAEVADSNVMAVLIDSYLNRDDAHLGWLMRVWIMDPIRAKGHDWMLGEDDYEAAPGSVRKRLEKEAVGVE